MSSRVSLLQLPRSMRLLRIDYLASSGFTDIYPRHDGAHELV
jgi:hypothetical protein